MELILWKTREMERMRQEMDRMVHQCLDAFNLVPGAESPFAVSEIALMETQDALIAKVWLFDVLPEDIEIHLTRYSLQVSVARPAERSLRDRPDGWGHARGFVVRSVRLPRKIDLDRAEARFAEGLLTVRMPKSEGAEPGGTKIRITEG